MWVGLQGLLVTLSVNSARTLGAYARLQTTVIVSSLSRCYEANNVPPMGDFLRPAYLTPNPNLTPLLPTPPLHPPPTPICNMYISLKPPHTPICKSPSNHLTSRHVYLPQTTSHPNMYTCISLESPHTPICISPSNLLTPHHPPLSPPLFPSHPSFSPS